MPPKRCIRSQIVEHFCLGRRRLELFGLDRSPARTLQRLHNTSDNDNTNAATTTTTTTATTTTTTTNNTNNNNNIINSSLLGLLLSKLDKQFPVEQFEATVSQSTVPSPPLIHTLPISSKQIFRKLSRGMGAGTNVAAQKEGHEEKESQSARSFLIITICNISS